MRDDDTANRQLIDGAVTDITACKHRDAESAWLAQFPGANPNPVLRIDRDGILLYCNKASGPLLETWGCRKRERVPARWRQVVLDALNSHSVQRAECR